MPEQEQGGNCGPSVSGSGQGRAEEAVMLSSVTLAEKDTPGAIGETGAQRPGTHQKREGHTGYAGTRDSIQEEEFKQKQPRVICKILTADPGRRS